MYNLLAYAESVDSSSTNLMMIVGGIFILATVVVLALVLVGIVRSRNHRRAELISTAAVFWAIITAATLLYAGTAQMKWSKEYMTRLETGYLDPQDKSGAPKFPWKTWATLGAAYAMMLAWSLSEKSDS